MPATYKIMTVPLDTHNPDQVPTTFDVRVVSTLEFPEGVTTTADVAAAIGGHPVLSRRADQSINAFAVPLASWIAAGKPPVVTTGIAVKLTYTGVRPLTALQEVLASYLSRPTDVAVSGVRHDPRFDALRKQDFLDINRVHDDLWMLRTYLHANVAATLGIAASSTADLLSYEQAKWMNSYVQSASLEVVFGDAGGVGLLSDSAVGNAARRLRQDVKKIETRLQTFGAAQAFSATTGLRSTASSGDVSVSVMDPNVAIHAALKNSLLSESIGIATSWLATAEQPVIGDHVLFLQPASFPSTAYPVVLQSTAFRRMGYTHPLAFADIPPTGTAPRTTNSALAYLNDEQGNPRYRATAINAEVAVIQGTLLQYSNSLSNTGTPVEEHEGDFTAIRDDRPPQLLVEEHRGINEPECAGLTITAPADDLVTPDALRDPQRETLWPCLFLEDLWIGFRLDLSEGDQSTFSSVHQQVQQITFSTSSDKVKGSVEDAFAREQSSSSSSVNSTEIIRYIGMSSAQARDYLSFLGTNSTTITSPDAPFQTKLISYAGATALLFGHVYRYRLRNVLTAGISLSAEEADAVLVAKTHVQSAPFFRARAFRPGEFVSTDFNNTNEASHSIYLTSEAPNANVWLVPTPIDMETARYHGVFLSKKSEPSRNSRRAFIQDVQKYFARRPSQLQYYFDPDVSAVILQVTVLNGDPDSTLRDFTYERGTYCELAPHLRLKPIRVEYGHGGNWEGFRPIEFRFSVTTGPHVKVLKTGRIIRILVPASADLEISILPDVGEANISRTASFAASTAQLMLRSQPAFKSISSIVPAVAEMKLRVTHCAKVPATRPLVAGAPAQISTSGELIVIAERGHLKETADLPGYVQIDSASAGQVRLEAAWSDINDDPEQDRPMLTAATSVSRPRSILFDKHLPPSASLMARMAMANASLFTDKGLKVGSAFAVQCAENKVFFAPLPKQTSPQINKACTLNFVDARRKLTTVIAVATSRYKSHFKTDLPSAFETRSEEILVDVPASMRIPAPEISHVVPLTRKEEELGADAGRTQRIYAMRIYLKPSWFVSGPGERLAIGCNSGISMELPRESLDKFVTQWGEDPLERPHLDVTRNAPRASNFDAPKCGNTLPLDDKYYPKRSIEGVSEVLYRDNLVVLDDTSAKRTISVASFALRRDATTKLWFCDVAVSDGFLGWCGLALYRHQPHAHDGLQLSATPSWAYGAVLHGEQIVWVRRGGKMHVTVGPVFDPNVSFTLDPRAYFNGISRDLTKIAGAHVSLQHYEVEGHLYYEGIVNVEEGPWSLVTRRFGSEVASIVLEAEG